MKLYYSPAACSLSPHIALEAAGLAYTTVRVDVRAQPHTTEHGTLMTDINPKDYVPALEIAEGQVLTEGPAIVQYIADQAPERELAPPAGTLARYRLQEWLNFIATEIHKGFSPLFYPGTPEAQKTAARERLEGRFAYLEKQLAEAPYLMGERFTVADGYLFTCLNWCNYLKMPLEGFPVLGAYMARVGALPYVQAALRAEGLLKG
ncbi:glutathione transferase GstA [Gulbenkiania mobilis]|uniref:Glutathione S-transferase n=1 Tax=Gulbenkiania mobilis TaxID=397457 RepID=A0ABY2D052_GULMO|nr:glutathione transferase GstA [Gulbenkiania mobilis]TCW33053.1 glutathione S-transferase [Gulbenkiania mobilis]